MAKVKYCAFCGKEMKTGFLGIIGNEVGHLTLGAESFEVCLDCATKYNLFMFNDRHPSSYTDRFNMKLANAMRGRKEKPSKDEIKKLFLDYYNEGLQYAEKSKNEKIFGNTKTVSGLSAMLNTLFDYSENGFFTVMEGELGEAFYLPLKDVYAKIRSAERKHSVGFTKDDISCIEYHVGKIEEDDMGLGYAVLELKLNDYKELSFKPAFIRTVISTDSKNPKKVRENAQFEVENFREKIGATDISIVCSDSKFR